MAETSGTSVTAESANTAHAADAPLVIDATVVDDVPPPAGPTCAACGAPCDTQDQFCNACGAALPSEHETAATELAQQLFLRCENCGAELASDPDHRSYVCPFCDSTYVVEFSRDQTDRQPPEFVIGFAVTPDDAQTKFHEWLRRNNWFRPGDLRTAQIAEKIKGVYLPFWSFSMLARSEWSASIGENWQRTETYTTTVNGKTVTRTRTVTETEWWPLAGRHHHYYSGYLVSGSRGLPQDQADRIKPFQLAALSRYRPYFLAGWMCEEYSIDREAALARCQQEFYNWEQRNVANLMPGDSHRSLGVRTTFSSVNSDLILLPVYVLSYRYRDRLFRFLVNGQTGRVAGDKPLSKTRITAAVLGGVGLIALIVLLFWLLGPR